MTHYNIIERLLNADALALRQRLPQRLPPRIDLDCMCNDEGMDI